MMPQQRYTQGKDARGRWLPREPVPPITPVPPPPEYRPEGVISAWVLIGVFAGLIVAMVAGGVWLVLR